MKNSITIFLIGLTLLFTALASHADECTNSSCVMVIDAGSTGSRAHIYSYKKDNANNPINIHQVWAKKITPGLASLEVNDPTINAYLNQLLSDTPATHLPVYLYATAGMRLLPKPNQDKIYTFIQHWFDNQDDWQLLSARTLKGDEEGIFGWLSINYQLDKLKTASETVGVMDIGGASVQIIFPQKNGSEDEANSLSLELYGQKISLFVHSFLGLGQTEVTHQFLDSPACFANNYELPSGIFAVGDAYLCRKEIATLLNQVHQVSTIVKPSLLSNSVNNWFIMGGIAFAAQSWPFTFTDSQLTPQAMLEQANNEICHQSWSYLTPRALENEQLYDYCLLGSYYYALLVDGYGLEATQSIAYNANSSADWTLGVILYNSAIKSS